MNVSGVLVASWPRVTNPFELGVTRFFESIPTLADADVVADGGDEAEDATVPIPRRRRRGPRPWLALLLVASLSGLSGYALARHDHEAAPAVAPRVEPVVAPVASQAEAPPATQSVAVTAATTSPPVHAAHPFARPMVARVEAPLTL